MLMNHTVLLPNLELDPKLARRFMAGHPWIYANELEKSDLTKSLTPGTLVTVSLQKQAKAIGYFNRHSLIAFRALSRNPMTLINTDFFVQRLKQALLLREQMFSAPYYRLVHAEGDELPGLIIDRFNDVFIVQLNTLGMELLKPLLIEALQTLFQPKTIYFQNDTSFRKMEGIPEAASDFIGEPITTLQVVENDLAFYIDFLSSQKTGWFFDHRNNRKLISQFVAGKSVIDYFCYSGGFALQAANAGASKVIAVDRSETALNNAKDTLKHLEHITQSKTVEFVCAETFKDMDHRITQQQRFDVVILDPPAFIKVKKDINVGLKGYEKLIAKGLQLLNPHGFLLMASCSHHAKLEDLKHCLSRALAKTERTGKIIHTLHAGPDHPLHPCLEESEYLKGFIVAI